MAGSTREILRRIKGIKSTQQITKAMEMVSESAVTIIPYFKGFYIATSNSVGGVSAHPMTYMWLDRAHKKA